MGPEGGAIAGKGKKLSAPECPGLKLSRPLLGAQLSSTRMREAVGEPKLRKTDRP